MPAVTKTKDPADELDYGRDWTKWLAKVDDELDASEWTITPAGELEQLGDATHNETITKITLKSGVAGKSYRVTNEITTIGGRKAQRSFTIAVRDL